MEFDKDGNPYIRKEILELLGKDDLTQGDIRAYIDKQKTLYQQNLSEYQSIVNPPVYGCPKCSMGKLSFLTGIRNKIAHYKILFHSGMYQPETAEIMSHHYDYFLEVADFFSDTSLGICHYNHCVGDLLEIRLLRVNDIVMQMEIDFQNEIVQAALKNDPAGTHMDLIEINRILLKDEKYREHKNVPVTDYEKYYLDSFKDLELYASKMAPLLSIQNSNPQMPNPELALNFEDFLTDEGKRSIPVIVKHFQNIKGVKIAYLLYALHELSFLVDHPNSLPQQKLIDALKKLTGNAGRRQALQSGLKVVDENRRKSEISRYKKILMS
ncbi:hypothetical protein BDD43_0178 [Mucilaginibacter gracilis]|uniref:Uncharacterized protein n=1 Tax=Mucilaginibacter gracilis TaxID=423350 RepID=A0A495ITI3_9SPHI|nr:hypothetical protein [Mucilaginibacter gracilis]RKR80085.1 hypothetical protein BDD43_0178 [Mucilaginibacter gracilis]